MHVGSCKINTHERRHEWKGMQTCALHIWTLFLQFGILSMYLCMYWSVCLYVCICMYVYKYTNTYIRKTHTYGCTRHLDCPDRYPRHAATGPPHWCQQHFLKQVIASCQTFGIKQCAWWKHVSLERHVPKFVWEKNLVVWGMWLRRLALAHEWRCTVIRARRVMTVAVKSALERDGHISIHGSCPVTRLYIYVNKGVHTHTRIYR